MKCLMCEKDFIAKSRSCKIDKRRVTCSKGCARVYRRVRYYLYRKIKTKFEKDILKSWEDSNL